MASANGKERKFVGQVREARKEVCEQILADMREHELNWMRPWVCGLSAHNPVSGTIYKGGNRVHLAARMRRAGYDDPRWVTYRQAAQNGWQVLKGEKSSIVEHWKLCGGKFAENDDGELEYCGGAHPVLVGVFHVFNAAQIDGMPAYEPPRWNGTADADSTLDRLEEKWLCPIVEGSDDAAYSPARDLIRIPGRAQFSSGNAAVRTLLHEMAHSTGHPARLARDMFNMFGTPAYAKEELVAELGSMFAATSIGLGDMTWEKDAHYQQHLAYLQSWMRAIRSDPKALFSAASAAQKAADLIVGTCFPEVAQATSAAAQSAA